MRYIPRNLGNVVRQAARHFPALVVTGPRRAGKTTLLRQLFPKAQYVLLEDPDIQGRIRSDPRTFLEELRPPVVFGEIQNAPELLCYVRTLVDAAPRRMGQWLFTGSQEAPLMRGITESMAGRAAILQLLPFSLTESAKVNMLHGGFPEVLARPKFRALWFASYLQTYLERDVRAITNIRDLVTFRRFLALLASRHGQILNKTDLAAPLGVSVPTISEWLHILEMTGQVIIVPRSEEHTSELQSQSNLVCRLLLEKKKNTAPSVVPIQAARAIQTPPVPPAVRHTSRALRTASPCAASRSPCRQLHSFCSTICGRTSSALSLYDHERECIGYARVQLTVD